MFVPLYNVSTRLTRLIEEISSLRERIISSPIRVAWKPALEREAQVRNAMGSTAIEGFVLSFPEVKALAEGKSSSLSLSTSERAVLNYLAALRFIEKHSGRPKLDHGNILKLHKIIAEGASEGGPLGEYRKVQNYVVGSAGVVYKPPTPAKVRGMMDELISWINGESLKHTAVIASGLVHYQFVRIHPFVDGNGRVGRILGTWELLRRRFDTLHIFAIDDLIYEHRESYYRALKAAQGGGELSGWLEFYLEIVAESLDRAWKRLASLPKTMSAQTFTLKPKQEKLLNLLRNGGPLSSKEMALALKVTVQGVHFLLQPLLKSKAILREGGRKTGKFRLV